MATLFLIMIMNSNRVLAQFMSFTGGEEKGIQLDIKSLSQLKPALNTQFEDQFLSIVKKIEDQFHQEQEKCTSKNNEEKTGCFKELINYKKKFVEAQYEIKLQYAKLIWDEKKSLLLKAKNEQIESLEKLYE